MARIDRVRVLRLRQTGPRERHQGPLTGGRGRRAPREDCEELAAESGLRGNCRRTLPLRARTAGSQSALPRRRRQVCRSGDRRRDGPGREGMRRVVLEVRGRALPRHVRRRGGARPSGEPLPVHPGAPVAGVERSRDRLRDAALPVQSGEGRAEGVPTRRNVLVNKGVLKTYLHNTSTAKKFRTKTTGNAGLVSPDPHAIFVKPGDRSRDEIFSEVKDGLWLTNTWYTRYQSYVTGDLSTIPRDGIFHIQKGDVAEAWKDIRLTDNLLHLLKNIVALSDKPEQMMWWGEVGVPNFVPYALIQDVGITKSAE